MIDISTFLIASVITIWIRKILGATKTEQPEQNFIADFKEGIYEFSKNKGVVWLVSVIMIVLFFVGLLQSLFLPFLLSLTSPKGAGITQSICASGTLIGSLFIGLFGSKSKQVKVLSISLFLAGLFFANLGFSTRIIYITMAGFMFFSVLPFVNTSIEVLIRKNIDNNKQGRVWSIISTITYLGSIVAFFVAGFLADNIFNPLLEVNGKLAGSVGSIIGIGEGRGIGLMFIVSGITISFISLIICRNKFINNLDDN
jgi:MFS family permease